MASGVDSPARAGGDEVITGASAKKKGMVSGPTMVAAFLLVAQLGGGTPGSNAAKAIEHSVTRPVPQAPTAPVYRTPDVWVPDRVLNDPMLSGTHSVPGHWERRLPDGQYYAPPFTVCDSGTGCATTPAGERPSPDTRTGP